MRRPGDSLISAKAEDWHYGPGFDGAKARRPVRRISPIMSAASGAEIIWLEDYGDGLADAMFTHDPSLDDRSRARLSCAWESPAG
jgi:dimethylargininase